MEINKRITIGKGAEAVVEETTFCGMQILIKHRPPKKYREKQLDEKLRLERTKTEAKLLHKAKQQKITCPIVYYVNDFDIYMNKFEGHTLNKTKITAHELKDIGKILAKLHSLDIIHADYTTANIMRTNKGTAVIDFGLSFTSKRIEDKANDLVTLMQDLGIESKEMETIINEYQTPNNKNIVARAYEVLKRGRYHKVSKFHN